MKHSRPRHVCWCVSLLLILSFFLTPSKAQVSSGTITGVVVDSSQAVVPLSVDTPQGGAISSARDPRQIQFALKFLF
ncbi:MAG: hypothetical protein AB1898_16380 [Acidobacteriota bacterium]